MAITGASGSGKSLFLRMIADLDPNEGEVSLGGVARAETAAPHWRRQVTYVAAEAGWWADEVADHFAGGISAARSMADRLGLKPELFDGPVARLSSGERQRLALVRALIQEPAALLLDEPTSSLDRDSVARVEAVLKERLAAGGILVLVTHDPTQASRLGDSQFEMRSGRLVPP